MVKIVDASIGAESTSITVDLVKASKTKTVVITGEGEYREFDSKMSGKSSKLVIPVQIDQKSKEWILSKPNNKLLLDAYGKDTKSWVGNKVKLQVTQINGRDTVMAIPIVPEPEMDHEIEDV